MSEHTHVDVKGEEIRHEHPTNMANAPHYHFEGDEDAERYGWAHSGPDAEACTSVYYPDIDGKPDPRSRPVMEPDQWMRWCDIQALERYEAEARRVAELEAGIRALAEKVWNDDRTPVRVARELERLLEGGEG